MEKRNFMMVFVCLFLLAACDGKRPDNGTLEVDIRIRSLQKDAKAELIAEDKVIASGKTDDKGEVEFGSLQNIGNIKIRVCGGKTALVSSKDDVAWNGCTESRVNIGQSGTIETTVDFFSSFIERYDSASSREEWSDYLGISTDPFPELQNTLTDFTKRWLWQQGFARIAERISAANGTASETQFSTEILLGMLFRDLEDDNVINGSTGEKFGSMKINASVLRGIIADSLNDVSDRFSAADLKEWSDRIRKSEAAFLGGEDAEDGELEVEIAVYPEGNKGAVPDCFSGTVAVEAKAEPESMAVSLNCFVNGDKMADSDDSADSFKGSFDSETFEDDALVTIRCDASNGESIKSREIQIRVNNEAPIISAFFYEHGTLNETASEDKPARNSIDVKVTAEHRKYNVGELECSIGDMTLAGSDNALSVLKTALDTTKLPEGKNRMECSAAVNGSRYSAAFDLYVANTAVVVVRPYIVHPLQDADVAAVSCGDDYNENFRGGADGQELKVKVKLGEICIVTVSGGRYRSVLSDEESGLRLFNGSLSAVVKPLSDADIVVTPLTSVEEYVFSARKAAGEPAEELYLKSKEHMLKHLSYAFEWNEKPFNTRSADSSTKYYVLLAGMEYLSYFLETNIGATHGNYTIRNILNLMHDDYADISFDGKSSGDQLWFGEEENKFALDANFFRYYYALAVKRFLSSGFNDTGFSQLGNIVSNIASNSDQFLFPAESAVIPVDSAGPVIEMLSFFDLFETESDEETEITGNLGEYRKGEERAYDPQNGSIPNSSKAFIVKFRVSPTEGNFIDLNSVNVKNSDQDLLFSTKRISPEGVGGSGFLGENAEFAWLVEYSGEDDVSMEKSVSFVISAEDIGYNGREALFYFNLDTKKPHISLTCPQNTVRAIDSPIVWKINDEKTERYRYELVKYDGDEEAHILKSEYAECAASNLCEEGSVSPDEAESLISDAVESGSMMNADGTYLFKVAAWDHAGNYSVGLCSFDMDSTPPEIPSIMLESNGKIISDGSVIKENFVTVSLVEPDKDISEWSADILCESSSGIFMTEKKTVPHSVHETAEFLNLPVGNTDTEFVKCKTAVSVCDSIGNCANEAYDSESIEFYIDDKPPFFWGYDAENSILTECIPHTGMINIPCRAFPNCVSGSGIVFLGGRHPQLLVEYTDNYSEKNDITLFIQSSEISWGSQFRQCEFIPNVDGVADVSCGKFYCDLRGSRDGVNNFVLRAYDKAGNYSERNISLSMDFNPVEPVYINIMEKFFTSKGKTYIWWETKSGVDYTCTISKNGDTSFSSVCSNNSDIVPGALSGTGTYKVTVESRSKTTARTDVMEFDYFDMKDFSAELVPVKGQFLHKGENMKVRLKTASLPFKGISRITLYLYGRYVNGNLQNNDLHTVWTNEYPVPVSSVDKLLVLPLDFEENGQFRNMRAEIRFSDSTYYSKSFTENSADSFLYCMLGSGESADNAKISFGQKKLSVKFDKPACVSPNQYSMKVKTFTPSVCGSMDLIQSKVTAEKILDTFFQIEADNIFYRNELHYHSTDCDFLGNFCDEIDHSCRIETHNFSQSTSLDIAYDSGVLFNIAPDSSVQWNSSPTEVIFYGEPYGGDCRKCENKMNAVEKCYAGEPVTVLLK